MEAKRFTYIMFLSVCLILVSARPSKGSYFTAWEAAGCNNQSVQYSKCGCSNIDDKFHGGYEFVFEGQSAAAYNTEICNGPPHTRFAGRGVQDCSGFGWKSFFIQC
uniref:Antimicrobial peptide 1 n=1 Tax=Picea sitchensis TaxID=3332 RepID=B8LM35_PICSI|nr:unknown [Picea sitchensis]